MTGILDDPTLDWGPVGKNGFETAAIFQELTPRSCGSPDSPPDGVRLASDLDLQGCGRDKP